MAWTATDVPPQEGRIAIVTGANTGIGLETAVALAEAGATVVLACRTPTKAEAAVDEIRSRAPGAVVEVLELDLGSLASVRTAANETRERFPTVDLLINNAGVMMPPRSTTADGFELQFGTNHLGHFAYTGLVLPTMTATAGSRVVTVSSIAHWGGEMRWADLQWEQGYSRTGSYSQSKLANLLFAFELDRRLAAAGLPTISLAAHPGVSATELTRHLPLAGLPGVAKVYELSSRLLFQSAAAGALPQLRAATDPGAVGSTLYGPDGRNERTGHPVLVMPRPQALVEEDQARLWSVSEELTGVEYPL